MTYERYLGMNRETLLEKIAEKVPAKRLKHMIGVEETCRHLAKLNGIDEEQAGLAGLLHDYAKKVSDEEFLSLIDAYHLDESLKQWGNNVWHGVVGIYKIKEDLGLEDEEILHAIAVHTVGDEVMSTLDKIVFVADYIEPNRDFPGVEEARVIAERSLDEAVAYEVVHTVSYLAQQAVPIHPQTIKTYNAFVGYYKKG